VIVYRYPAEIVRFDIEGEGGVFGDCFEDSDGLGGDVGAFIKGFS